MTDDSYADDSYADDSYADDHHADDTDREDDEFLASRRRRARLQKLVVGVAVVVLVLGVGLSRFFGSQRAAAEAERIEALLLRADPSSVAEAITATSALVAEDRGRSAAFIGLEVRSNLLYYGLYSGSSRLKRKAAERLEDAHLRAPDSAEYALSEALWHGLVGNPGTAVEILDSGAAGDAHPVWRRLVRAESARRMGDTDKAATLLSVGTDPLTLSLRLRSAWSAGEFEESEQLVGQLLAVQPDHAMATTVRALAASRRESAEQANVQLAPLLEAAQSMPNRLTAWVVVERARLALRSGSGEESRSRAQELLDSARTADDPAPELILEAGWLRLVNGSFGAAKTLASRGLREQPDESSLLALYASASFFNDSSVQIMELLSGLPEDSTASAGQIQARALAALVRREAEEAVEGLRATVHLGVPGQGGLFLTEALIQAGQAAEARDQARRARAKLAEVYGPGSRESALGAAYEGLALAAMGNQIEALECYELVLDGQNKTPWTAWLYGRTLQYGGETAEAKDALLLACHNGQDFARACWDLAEIYEELKLDALLRRTQSEARRHYLRTSPKGWRAEQLRGAR